ncbi:CU044_5270 family protein [Kribbella sp. NPDC049174]|uniref:CU044_5270 family protein n=1 Tax=Kribbella sp. NPDC049174 TaxID=3364112 RepID=UPI003720630D
MTDLKNLLDQAAGSVPAVTDAEVAADLARARRAARRRRFTGAGLTTVAAAIAIGALAVPLVLSPGSDPAVSAPPAAGAAAGPVAELSAGQVLLVAAAHEEKAEATTGTYFRVRKVQSREWTVTPGKIVCCGSQPAGPGGYKLRELVISETWTGLKGGTGWLGVRSLGASPATPADEAAWRRAGSPSSWNTGPADTSDRKDRILSSKPGDATFFEVRDGADRYTALGLNGTLDDVLALPSTPDKLRARLLEMASATAPDASQVVAVAQISSGLLSDTPALPKVRAATYRLLAGLPGATVKHNVVDLAGRTGTAVGFSFPAYQLNLQLIIDPKTGKLLSSSHTGGKNGDSTVLLSGWTDDTPQAPPAAVK